MFTVLFMGVSNCNYWLGVLHQVLFGPQTYPLSPLLTSKYATRWSTNGDVIENKSTSWPTGKWGRRGQKERQDATIITQIFSYFHIIWLCLFYLHRVFQKCHHKRRSRTRTQNNINKVIWLWSDIPYENVIACYPKPQANSILHMFYKVKPQWGTHGNTANNGKTQVIFFANSYLHKMIMDSDLTHL